MSFTVLQAAIHAHIAWKEQFELLIEGLPTKSVDAKTVGDCDRCALGQWLSGNHFDDQARPLADQLSATHSEFHAIASEIAGLVNRRERQEAKKLMISRLEPVSQRIIDQLQAMRHHIKNARPLP